MPKPLGRNQVDLFLFFSSFFSRVLGDVSHGRGKQNVLQLQHRCDSFVSGCLTVWVIGLTRFRCVPLNNNRKGVSFFFK